LESPEAGIPPPVALIPPRLFPYHLLADGGFGLSDYVLTPFTMRSADTDAKRYYNHRLSRYIFDKAYFNENLNVIEIF
jgi:hypothetical protein